MPTSVFDARIEQLESRIDKAETLQDSVGLVLEKIELAREHAQRGRRTSIVLAAESTVVVLTAALARRHGLP